MVILLGDYNDDVDYTVSDVPTTISSYGAYVMMLPLQCSNKIIMRNSRSYVTYGNMIDHITLSNELSILY
jgi:hypothetical protein